MRLLRGRHWPLSRSHEISLMKALAVPVLGRIAHEAREVPVRIAHHRVVVLKQGVVVNIDNAGVGDRLVLGILWTDVVAVDDGMHLVILDEDAGRPNDLLGGLGAGVDEMRLDRPGPECRHGH